MNFFLFLGVVDVKSENSCTIPFYSERHVITHMICRFAPQKMLEQIDIDNIAPLIVRHIGIEGFRNAQLS